MYTRLIFQLCGSSGPTGYPRKCRPYFVPHNLGPRLHGCVKVAWEDSLVKVRAEMVRQQIVQADASFHFVRAAGDGRMVQLSEVQEESSYRACDYEARM